MTTSFIRIMIVSINCCQNEWQAKLTRILGILWAYILITGVEHILIHEGGAGCDLPEERDFDGLANLDSLAFLHEDLPRVLAPVLTIERWHTILLRMMALFEWLESCHEVMSSRDTGGDDALRDTGRDGTLDDGGDGVHGSDDLVLELRWYVEFDLLEEILGGAETTDNQYVL